MQRRKKNLTLSHNRINPNQLNNSVSPFSAITVKMKTKTKQNEHLEALPVAINLILLFIVTHFRARSKLLFVVKRSQPSSFQFSDFIPLLDLSVSFCFFLSLFQLFPQITLRFSVHPSSQHGAQAPAGAVLRTNVDNGHAPRRVMRSRSQLSRITVILWSSAPPIYFLQFSGSPLQIQVLL